MSQIVRRVLQSEKNNRRGEINVIFVDNKKIRTLNKSFLKERSLTDVIAFSYDATEPARADHPWADIYISVPHALANARVYKESAGRELVRLIIHGMLHVLGYKDDTSARKKRMWARQEKLVRTVS